MKARDSSTPIRAAAHFHVITSQNLSFFMFLYKQFSKAFFYQKIPISRIIARIDKHYRIVVSKETSDSANCIIIRRWRLLGCPWFGPHTRLNIKIIEENSNFKLSYSFFWPEYIFYWVISSALSIFLVLSKSTPISIGEIFGGVILFVTLIIFSSLLVFIDIYFFYTHIKNQ